MNRERSAGRILIIDDDRLTRWSLARTLAREGSEVLEAASGAQGLECSREWKPDLIILDLRLPDANGLQLLQLIWQAAPRLPIVLMSADLTSDTRREAQRLGVHWCLEKPILPSRLAAILSSVWALNRRMPAGDTRNGAEVSEVPGGRPEEFAFLPGI